MNFRRNYLSAAVVAALAGGVAPGDVGAVTLSQDDIGDVGLVPYFTMRDGWSTDFYIINTSSSTTAVKVRFHEARNSREVLDFIVVLSPYDKINFWAALGNDGPKVQFPKYNSEKTCVVPIPDGRVDSVGGSLPFSDSEYTGVNYDNWPSSQQDDDYGPLGPIDRALEGYATVIEMGSTKKGAVYDASLHPDPDCQAIADAFLPENIVDTYNQFDRNLNNLKVGYSLTNVARGTQGAENATMLSNFATKYSWIAHTYTSTLASANTYAEDITAAQEKVNDALDGVAEVKATMCASGIQDCANLTDGDDDPGNQCSDPQGTSNPSVSAVEDACGTTIGDAYNVAISELATAQAELTAAENALDNVDLGPAKNLIAAQDGSTAFGDQERYPNLNSGDFVAYWLVDGQYQHEGNYDKAPYGWWLTPFGMWWGVYARPVDAVTALLMRSDAVNEWAYNPNTGASTDLVMTAPTKNWYTDWYNVYKNNVHLVGISPILEEVVQKTNVGWPPFGNQFVTLGSSCDEVGMGFWNNDELAKAYHQVPSPTPTIDLCWETNVVYTGERSILGTEVGQQFDVRSLFGDSVPENQTYNGWLDLKMTMEPHNYHPAIPWLNFTLPNWYGEIGARFIPWDEVVQVGMPYLGFAYKERDLGNPNVSYGSIADHSYIRNWEYRNALGGTWTLFGFDTDGNNFPQPEDFIPQGE